MRYERIEIDILPDGKVEYDVQGMKGKSCITDTAWLDDALGKVTNREFKREYVEEEHQLIHG
jgi:hypothetical protein